MRKRRHPWKWYRAPQSTNEKRQAYIEPDLVRPKRNPKHLPNGWDDKGHNYEKSWKRRTKNRKQWMREHPRMFNEVTFFIPARNQRDWDWGYWQTMWDFKDHLRDKGYLFDEDEVRVFAFTETFDRKVFVPSKDIWTDSKWVTRTYTYSRYDKYITISWYGDDCGAKDWPNVYSVVSSLSSD